MERRDLKAPISEFFPKLFQRTLALAEGESPIITTGSMLTLADVHLMPVIKGLSPRRDEKAGLTMYPALAGYAFLKSIADTNPKDFYKLLWTPCKEIALWVGACYYSDPLAELLRVYDATKFGNAKVEATNKTVAVPVSDIVGLIRDGLLEIDMTVKDLGSTRIEVAPGATLREAIEKMLARNVRRLFLSGRESKFVSGRTVLGFLFSSERLYLARDHPEKWIQARVSDLVSGEARDVSSGATVRDACTKMGDEPDDCLVTDDGKVVSRWDLVMKPWKSGRLK